MRVRLLHNPFYAVSDNLASCWVARHEMTGEFFIINGDTLSEPAIAKRLLANDKAPIVVTIDRKSNYDADDMKVSVEGDRLRSEEHTSELQSLMRISYAVFCLKKKTKHKNRK